MFQLFLLVYSIKYSILKKVQGWLSLDSHYITWSYLLQRNYENIQNLINIIISDLILFAKK